MEWLEICLLFELKMNFVSDTDKLVKILSYFDCKSLEIKMMNRE